MIRLSLRVLCLSVLLGAALPAAAQKKAAGDLLLGNWYSFGRDRVIRFTIRKDSLITQHLNWDGTPRLGREGFRQGMPVVARVTVKDIHCLGVRRDGATEPTCFRFPVATDRNSLWLVEPPVPNAPADTSKKAGIPFMRLLGESEVQRLRQLPPIDGMTTADFRKYVGLVTGLRRHLAGLQAQGVAPGTLRYEGFSRMRSFVGQVGYNPFYEELQYMRLIDRFHKDPETKALVAMLLEE